MSQSGIRSRFVNETPFAVIDFETTGLRAGADRVVEVSVVRIDPQKPPKLVLDTLVNPRRKMSATEIHGITEDDVADAPGFADIAGEVRKAISGAVVASYNVYFDLPFLQHELTTAGLGLSPDTPHLCVMYLRPMLSLGKRCGLDDACSVHGVARAATHMASADAVAAAELLQMCVAAMGNSRINTFHELAALKDYKFLSSFDSPLPADGPAVSSSGRAKSRSGCFGIQDTIAPKKTSSLAIYWETLVSVLSDLVITEEEIANLAKKQSEFGIVPEQVRALHARAFAHVISQFVEDRFLDEAECRKLNRLYSCLQKLGWAPGQTI